jgi:hypothetical protein
MAFVRKAVLSLMPCANSEASHAEQLSKTDPPGPSLGDPRPVRSREDSTCHSMSISGRRGGQIGVKRNTEERHHEWNAQQQAFFRYLLVLDS